MNAKYLSILLLSLMMLSFTSGDKKFPSQQLKDLNGKTVNTDKFVNDGKITVVSFWATWCTPCQRELDIYNEVYEEWVEKYDLEIVAITIDNARQLTKVKPLVAQKQWPFTILSDSKQELQKAMNFTFVPQTFILDKKGNIVFDHSGFKPGDEYEMEEIFDKLIKK
ncbi:MAG TPA: TlpA family protein disulfide reductase [Bacteroidetes bacterium]|nr:TlpA family protein disulfide reductase [Bacteroidota bacterium]